MRGAVKGHRSWRDSKLLPHGYTLSTHRARLDHVLGFSACCSVAHALRMASGLLLGLLVGGPGLFPTYFASARATCTPPTAFVSSALRLVKGYKLPPAALEEKVTFTIWAENRHVPEFGHRSSGNDVRLSSFVDGAEIFSAKDAEMAIPGTLQAAIAQDFMQSMLQFLSSFCSSSHALQDVRLRTW